MTKKRRRYAAEYRQRMIDLVRGRRTPEDLSREFEASAQAIRNWVVSADRAEGRRSDGWTAEERKDLREVRRKVRRLQEERDIPKNAAAWFVRENPSSEASPKLIPAP